MRYDSVMSTITLKNVPDVIHAALKSQAKAHGRSLNKEIICALERVFNSSSANPDELLNNARAVRESMGMYLTQRELKAMKEEGRP
jgi:plasmid stability protein